MHTCNNMPLNAFQRHSKRLIGIMMGICLALSLVLQAVVHRYNLSTVTHYGIAVISVAPIIMTMILIGRYLSGEKDEYLRNLVVQSILWGFGVALVADTFFGYIIELRSTLIPFGSISMDIFVVTAMITLEIKLWRNQ
jgi:hypothetical protein